MFNNSYVHRTINALASRSNMPIEQYMDASTTVTNLCISSTTPLKLVVKINNYMPVMTLFTTTANPSLVLDTKLHFDAGTRVVFEITNMGIMSADAYVSYVIEDPRLTYGIQFDAMMNDLLTVKNG